MHHILRGKMKLLTVAVPTYNTEKYLERCLLSLLYDIRILDQLEIIIVNDGSTDKSLAIAQTYEKRFPNTITVINKENGGHGSTINAALRAAKGKYFRILDSDDWVNIIDFPKHFQDLEKYNVDLILTNYTRELVYNGSCEEFKYSNKIGYNKIYNLHDFNQKLLEDYYFFLATSVYKTETLRKSDFLLDEKTFYVDMELVVFSIKETFSFVYLDYNIYRYFIGRDGQSISVASMVKNRRDHEKVLNRLIDFFVSTKLPKNKHEYVAKIIILMINTHYMIYCGSKALNDQMLNEIICFDKSLRDKCLYLYKGVSKKFPYINYYRSTNFIFTRIMFTTFRAYVNYRLRITERKRA